MKSLAYLTLALGAVHAAADVSVIAGSACNAVLPGQAKQLEWRESGLINPSSSKDFFVVCPMTRVSASSASGDLGYWGSALVVSATATAGPSSTVSCQLREMTAGTRVASRSVSITLEPDQTGVLRWDPRRVRDDALSSYHASCRMPPQTEVNAIVTVSSADSGSEYLSALEAKFDTP